MPLKDYIAETIEILKTLPNATEILYVSPLKALSNDVHKNLDIPLKGIADLARSHASLNP